MYLTSCYELDSNTFRKDASAGSSDLFDNVINT